MHNPLSQKEMYLESCKNQQRAKFLTIYPDWWILLTWYLIMLSEVLNGPFRFYAESMGLPMMVYLPKLLTVVIIIKWFAKFTTDRLVLATLSIFVFASIVASVQGLSSEQIGFGYWIYQYLLIGIPMWATIQRNQKAFFRSCMVGWLITVVGVFINSQITFPWAGFSYSLGGVEVEGAREWSTYDIDRLAGFGRSSTSTAGQILVFALMALPIAFSKGRIAAIFMALISISAILFTTAKSVAGAYIISVFVWVVSGISSMAMLVALISCIVFAILPFSTVFITYRLAINSWWGELLFQSFEERLIFTWPMSIERIIEIGDPIFGRGLGGVGSPQKNFSIEGPSLYDLSFTDSLSLFLYGTFGIFGLCLLIALSYGVCKRISREGTIASCIAITSFGCLLNGGATDLVESGIPAVFIGLAIALLVYKPPRSV